MRQSNGVVSDDVESCGARLQRARELLGITLEEASGRLKMPVRVLLSLENDEWRSGAPVFVRGQLRSYARMLDVDIEPLLVEAGFCDVRPSELVSHTHTPKYQRIFEQAARRGIYIAITAVIAVPVWLATRPHLANTPEVQSLEIPVVAASALDPPALATQRTPVIASMGAIRTPAAATETGGLSLAFTGDSWLQVSSADGRVIEQGLLGEGERRHFDSGDASRIVLGNISAIEALHNGQPVNLAPFSRANVARFTLSSDGSLAPIID